jgi:aryl-alcohol dehydrogenase-like predicted oxidoreductase
VEASLRRLQTDHIDLYQAHKDDEDTPLEETLEAFAALIKEGKVRSSARRTTAPPRLPKRWTPASGWACRATRALQPLYNLYDRAVFEKSCSRCASRGRGRDQLLRAGGRLPHRQVPQPEDAAKSPRGGGTTKKYLNERGLKILAALDKVAKRTAVTPAQVAVAWQMAQPGVTRRSPARPRSRSSTSSRARPP